MSRRAWRSVCALAVVLACAPGPRAGAAAPPGPPLPVVWSGTTSIDPRAVSGFNPPRMPAELVVVGAARLTQKDRHPYRAEVQVDRVLYGHWNDKKTLRMTVDWWQGPETGAPWRAIFALTPARGGGKRPFDLVAVFPREEEKAVAALGAAWLDYYALSARCIFLGRELAHRDDQGHYHIEVVRHIAGAKVTTGQRVKAIPPAFRRWGGSAPAGEGRHKVEIHFVSAIKPGPVFEVCTRQPAEQEADVRAALRRRTLFPVGEPRADFDDWADETGQPFRLPRRYREIVYRGTTAEAIDLLGSEVEGARDLAERKLAHEWKASRSAVVRAVERQQVRFEAVARGDHRRLGNLVSLLGRQEKGSKEVIHRLIERQIAFLARGAPQPPQPPERDPWRRGREEHREDVNHALAWLLVELGEDEAFRLYSGKLLRLRDTAKGRWRAEAQLALDVCRVEERIELAAALKRLRGRAPVRAPVRAGHAGAVRALYFAADGKTLRTLGEDGHVCSWDRTALRPLRRVALPATLKVLSAREPDGKLLACVPRDEAKKAILPGQEAKVTLKFVDADTGRVAATASVTDRGWGRSDFFWLDGSNAAYLAAHPEGAQVFLLDCRTGKVLQERTWKGALFGCVAISHAPDGKSLLAHTHHAGMGFYCRAWSLPLGAGKARELAEVGNHALWGGWCGLVPGGKYVYLASPDVRVLDRTTLRVISARAFRHMDLRALSFSADGSRYAVVVQADSAYSLPVADKRITCLVRVHDTLSGRTLAAVPLSAAPDSVRLSSDGRHLAVAERDNTFALWDLVALNR